MCEARLTCFKKVSRSLFSLRLLRFNTLMAYGSFIAEAALRMTSSPLILGQIEVMKEIQRAKRGNHAS